MNFLLQMLLILKRAIFIILYISCEIEILRQKAPDSTFSENSFCEPEIYKV